MIIFVYFLLNASGLVWVKNLRKWAEKAFVSSTLVFHEMCCQDAREASFAVFPEFGIGQEGRD
jgi:hypothetical protein